MKELRPPFFKGFFRPHGCWYRFLDRIRYPYLKSKLVWRKTQTFKIEDCYPPYERAIPDFVGSCFYGLGSSSNDKNFWKEQEMLLSFEDNTEKVLDELCYDRTRNQNSGSAGDSRGPS